MGVDERKERGTGTRRGNFFRPMVCLGGGVGGVVWVWLYLLHQKATVSGQGARVPAAPPVPGTVAGLFSYTAE